MPDGITHKPVQGWRWAIVILLMVCAGLGIRMATTGIGIDSDIQAILPQSGTDAAEIAAIRHAGASASSRIVIGVTGSDAALRRAGAAVLEYQLVATGMFAPAADDFAETAAWTRANRYELACMREPQAMDAAWGAALVQKARIAVFSGMVPLTGADFAADPFLLDLHQLGCLSPDPGARGDAEVAGRLTASPFALTTQDAIAGALAEWRSDARFDELALLRSGAVFFAEAAGAQAKQEITLVGGASIALILLLYTLSFRSPRTAGLALMTVALGAMGGAWVCFMVFGAVHFSVFVFGSALTGVSADYAVHTFAARRAAHFANGRRLRRALTISMLTSAAGFGALLVFDIALFVQIGMFAIGGLASAWMFAVMALPRLDRAPAAPRGWPAPLLRWLRQMRIQAHRRVVAVSALIAVAVICIVAFPNISFVDDLRQFQTLSPALKAEQDALFPDASARFTTQFLLSSGANLDAARRAEERTLAALGASTDRFMALSRFDPSSARRAANRSAYETHLFAPHLATYQAELGLAPHAMAPASNGVAQRPAWLNALHFEYDGQTYLLAPMFEGGDATSVLNGVHLIDPARIYGGALQSYRETALTVFAVAAIFAALLLALANRQARAAILIAPPLIGCALALAIPAFLGTPITLFSILALFIVLGAGIDFSVFQWEMGQDDTGWTSAAVVIAALSTCAAMGMLGFSTTLPVQSFGITIAIGVLGAMVFSFMVPHRQSDGEDARNL